MVDLGHGYSVADPGFPVGGVCRAVGGGGGADLRCGHFSAKTYAKTKELDPVGGGGVHTGGTPWIRQWYWCNIEEGTLSACDTVEHQCMTQYEMMGSVYITALATKW